MRRFQCLGKTQKGTRCKTMFLTSNYSTVLTCTKHKDQNVTFQYSELGIGDWKDVASVIASHIDDPKTFQTFASVCRSTAKACHDIQDKKKYQFSHIKHYMGGYHYRFLPNGDML